jgi:hypothetical protein
MDIRVADYQDYELELARLQKLAGIYKKVIEVNEGDQACQDRDDLMATTEERFSEWQNSFTDQGY